MSEISSKSNLFCLSPVFFFDNESVLIIVKSSTPYFILISAITFLVSAVSVFDNLTLKRGCFGISFTTGTLPLSISIV